MGISTKSHDIFLNPEISSIPQFPTDGFHDAGITDKLIHHTTIFLTLIGCVVSATFKNAVLSDEFQTEWRPVVADPDSYGYLGMVLW
jgi:hypothetical protein